MKIRPLYDRVVIRRKEEEQTSAGGIVLPGSAQEKPNHGETRPLALKVGDTVIFGQYSGNAVKVDGEELIIMSESEIYGVID
jgi:chaperonin GroES